MKQKKNFFQSQFFNVFLPFLLVVGFGIAAWPSIKPPPQTSSPHRAEASLSSPVESDPLFQDVIESRSFPEPKDNFQRRDTQGKFPEDQVSAMKRELNPVDWDDDYRVVLQLNFPDSTRAAFMLIVRHEKSKCLLQALADTRSEEWKKKIWIGSALDENLKPDNHAIPFELDAVRKIQQQFRKFEPYWLTHENRDQLLIRDAWLSAMTIAILQKESMN
jgi:hypothetical protein